MKKRIKNVASEGKRLDINIDEVRQFDPKLAAFIIRSPIEAISIFEELTNNIIEGL
jgi:DNA replicative helicase MCM subunit Mcm2 (Cdc46/Mcm family)